MNKAELISAMAAESGLSKTDSKKALDAFIASVTKAMKAGDKVSLVGFWNFQWWKEERVWVSTSTKKPIEIAAKKVVKFKPGTELTAE